MLVSVGCENQTVWKVMIISAIWLSNTDSIWSRKADNHQSSTLESVFSFVCFPYITVTADMEEFIEEYIAEANKEIELFNRQLELQGQPDLFDPW